MEKCATHTLKDNMERYVAHQALMLPTEPLQLKARVSDNVTYQSDVFPTLFRLLITINSSWSLCNFSV
jgi:hypothetical protein